MQNLKYNLNRNLNGCGRGRRGFIATDVVVGVALICLIAGLAARAGFDYQRAVAVDDWNRATLWAAQAQLQRCQAGAPLDSLPPEGLTAEEITLKTTHEAGQGQWQGFEHVTVVAEAVSSTGRPVRAQVSGYVPREDKP